MSATEHDEKALRREMERLEGEIENAKQALTAVKRALGQAISPFKVGDVITWRYGKGRRKGRVVRIVPPSTPDGQVKRWYAVNIRKDGTDGATVSVWDLDKPQLFTEGLA